MQEVRECKRCGRVMVSITLAIAERSRRLRSCSYCDIREWETDEGSTALLEVLSELNDASSQG
jgi:transcription elongation factor Elf1